MALFKPAYDITRKVEGEYANDPTDRGGETYKGIARKKNPQWEGWKIVDSLRNKAGFPKILDANQPLVNLVLDFYKKEYWNVHKLDSVNNQLIANELFDTSVNMGIGTAGIFLQRVLNVSNVGGNYYPDLKIDGNIGAVTIAALNKHPRPVNVLKGLNCLQGAKYIEICEANPAQEKYYHGWMERVMEYDRLSMAA
jgi:lysozyme family protein